MSAASSYPLAWPMGVPRTKSYARNASRFKISSVAVAYEEIEAELSRAGAVGVVISMNVPLKANGRPYSNPGRLPDPGVTVYFRLRGHDYAMPCDRWVSVEENLWAIAKHIEALRGQMRWGVATVDQAFAGFKALASAPAEDCWMVLGVSPTATVAQINSAWREKARTMHPDAGGSHSAMAKLNGARDQALAQRKSS